MDFDEGRHEEEFDLRIGSFEWMCIVRENIVMHCGMTVGGEEDI